MNNRSEKLACRLEDGARALMAFGKSLSDVEWNQLTPGDGRTVGVIVHHVGSVYPIEIELAQCMARGEPVTGVTWDVIRDMNATHAATNAAVTKDDALALVQKNSSAAAVAIRALDDAALDNAVTVSLYGNATLTCQFFLEDHAVRHSLHHLARLRSVVGGAARETAPAAV
jgi:hypothetical protein